jgi:hypothetical protein
MSLSQSPRDAGAPIMSYNRSLLSTEIANQANYILHKEFDAVVLNSSRFVAEIVATHVWRNDMVSCAQDW